MNINKELFLNLSSYFFQLFMLSEFFSTVFIKKNLITFSFADFSFNKEYL